MNNALGYAWADQGKNLEQAKEMIKKAVSAQPSESAFLDSMGWVCYKLGQFDEAVTWLTRAQRAHGGDEPVSLGHLGDAHYRAGDLEQAVQAWQRGQERIPLYTVDDDPEIAGLPDRLNQRLRAAMEHRPAPVADVPSLPGPAQVPPGVAPMMPRHLLPH